MKKYYLFFKNSISESLVYRAHFFFLIISQLISLTVFIYLWNSVYSEGNKIGNYSLEMLISYYIFSAMLGFIIFGTDVAWRVGDEIRLGEVTNFILKPLSYFWSTFFIVIGNAVFNLIVTLIIIIPIAIYNHNYLGNFTGWEKLSLFVLSASIALLIYVLFFFLVGITSFWMGNVRGLNFLVRMIMFFLSGGYIPLDVLPKTFINFNDFLPFKFITWFPVSIWNGRVESNLINFMPAFFWVFTLGIAVWFVYKKGLEKYEGYGA